MARYTNEDDLLVKIMDLNLDHVQGDDGRELCQVIQALPTAGVQVFFAEDEIALINEYKDEVKAVDFKTAILNAVAVSLDRVDNEPTEETHDRFNEFANAQPEPCEDAVSRAKINSFCHEIIRRDPMGNNDVVQAFESFRAHVNSLPSVQPERKKGRWERHNTYHGDDTSGFIDPDWRCSECGRQANVNEWSMYDLTDFCHNCGADMRGESDGIQGADSV